jgi:hypothetical protein
VKNWFVALALLLVLAAPFAQAGTLVSGSRVDVQSNYDGFKGLTLIGTWSTTPAANDRLSITNAQLPAPYGLRETVDITVQQPVIEQVFRVGSQEKLERLVPVERSYLFLNLPFGKTSNQLCQEKFEADRLSMYGGKPLMEGSSAVAKVAAGSCSVLAVLVDSQAGWVGTVTDKGIYYEQKVDLDGIGTLRLAVNERENDLSDQIDGVGRATLLSFGSWTNAKLSSRDLYGYHGKNALGSDTWKPFADSTGMNNYRAARSRIAAADGVSLGGGFFFFGNSGYSTVRSELQSSVQQANNEVARIVGVSSTIPSSWGGATGGAIRYTGNDIIVPLQRTALVANVQLILAGEKFGLFIPTGEPKIVSADSSIKFSETSSGNLNYRVKNVGTDTGTFRLRSDCGGQVVSDDLEFALKAGEEKSGLLRLTAKSQSFSKTETLSCTLELKEIQINKADTKKFSTVIEVKQQCTEGEETEPTFDSAKQKYAVYVLDSSCSVKSTKECALAEGTFVKENGAYVCKAHTPGSVISPPAAPSEPTFRLWILVTSVVIGLAAAFGTLVMLAGMVRRLKWGGVLLVFVIVFIAATIGSAFLIKGFIGWGASFFALSWGGA